jgi:hypothetical protein
MQDGAREVREGPQRENFPFGPALPVRVITFPNAVVSAFILARIGKNWVSTFVFCIL